MARRVAMGVGVAAGTALLVAGVGSAGLFGLRTAAPGSGVVTPPATSTSSARPTPTPSAVDPVPADVLLAEQALDPAALPVRAPAVIAVLVETHDRNGEVSYLAFDAGATQWVRLELPGGQPALSIHLAPDGRAVLRQQYAPETSVAFEVVDLATGEVRPVPVPVAEGRVAEDCFGDDAAWASSGRVGIVSGCLVPTSRTGAGPAYDSVETWVHEVDLATGGTRVVEHVPESVPFENLPSYSPDGRFLVYGIGYREPEDEDAEEEWETLRVTGIDGSGAQERFMTHIARGDPWADADTVLGWDDVAEIGAPDAYLLLDARTGETTPLGVEGLTNVHGFVGGRLVVEDGPWSPETAPVTLAVLDLGTGQRRPWLALPDGVTFGSVSVARDAVTP